jgi:hypothetical protein
LQLLSIHLLGALASKELCQKPAEELKVGASERDGYLNAYSD